ncbi:arabinan endo-1 like protein [Verticillium longisporum]|uniref:Arabinan endo-1 like protein n=2 Tax=Verticillium longisporum TaxID=100787 RepID=A0A8I2ZAQ9_VERLO|nr:arabinan endo-1 like protein [Verticillium longisporum]
MIPSRAQGLLAATALAAILPLTAASPIETQIPIQPLYAYETTGTGDVKLETDFPDPCILQDDDGLWYSFATNSAGRNVQAAVAPDPLGPWTYLDGDAMPDHSWTSGRNTWAPDVGRTGNDSYILYFSGELPDADGKHCVGVALADSMTGPYRPMPEPWACHLDQGGAIDPAGFHDVGTGRRYVVYKVDGNHDGNGGDCGNSVDPVVSTPIMLQEVGPDGFTKIGNPVQILDRTEADGPLVEAPDIVRLEDGTYVLFFSSWCYASDKYNINYAFSRRVEGPYIRSLRPLLQTGDYGLVSPGGATSIINGGQMVFHANCDNGRCLYATRYAVLGLDAII